MILTSKKGFIFCLSILIISMQVIDGARGGGGRSSSGSRGSSSSSSSRGRSSSSSSRGSSSSSSSRGSSSSSSSRGSSSSSNSRGSSSSSNSKGSSSNGYSQPKPGSYGQAAQPYTPKANSFNSQGSRNGQSYTPRPNSFNQQGNGYGQPAQPYTSRPNSFNQQGSWNGQSYTPRPNSFNQQGNGYGQPAQPYTPRPNSFNQQGSWNGQSYTPRPNSFNQQGSWNGQQSQPYTSRPNSFNQRPTNTGNYGWQQGQAGQPQGTNWPNPQQQVPPWQSNGMQPGRPAQWGHNTYPQQRPYLGTQPGPQQWHQPAGQPIIINSYPQGSGSSTSSFQQKFQTVANMMTMYNFYHNIKSQFSRPNYNNYYGPNHDPYFNQGYGRYPPGHGQYPPGHGQYPPGHGQYPPGQGQFTPEQDRYLPPGPEQNYSNWLGPNDRPGFNDTLIGNSSMTVPNDNVTRYSHYWFPEPPNFYNDFWNFSESSVSVYDSSSDGCCSGKAFSFKKTRNRNCCGSTDYDPTFYVCCGEKTHFKRSEFTCCGNEYYNYEESLCGFKPMEGPVVVRLPFEIRTDPARKQRTICCGEKLIDIQTHVCCGVQSEKSYSFSSFPMMYGNDTRCCYGKIINGKDTMCENTPLPHRSGEEEGFDDNPYPEAVGMCANELYNPGQKICCTVYDYSNQGLTFTQYLFNKTTTTTGCCANSTYDTKSELCCEGTVYENATNQACCGESPYNVTTNWCCMGTNLTILSNAAGGQDGCCGEEKKAYSSKTQMCCANSVLDIPNINETFRFGCCASKDKANATTFDRYLEVCCDGVVHKINGSFPQECCGKKLIDMSSSLCCAGQMVDKTKYAACCNETKIYNISTHTCCNGNAVVKPSSLHMSCCGQLPFSANTEICCYNPMTSIAKVAPRRSPWMQCCDTTPFDEATQTCCENEVIDNNGTSICCMQFDPFIPRMSHAVVKKTSANNFCCGLKVFNPDKDLCCNLTVYDTKGASDAKCCGSAMFRADNELCCNGVIHKKKYIESACCGDKVYNVSHDICCGNVIKWKGASKNPSCCFPGMQDF